ncbi:hypothetical protein AX15_007358 [Amanita polypyramis BW_CC]|nr:hypothetical protein AX15_007358 [Amanita polypyramis BW_CC]
MSTSVDTPSHFVLPDFASHCTYPLRINPHYKEVASASEQWLLEGGDLSPEGRHTLEGLKGGELVAMCYPDTDAYRLRVCNDYINYLFNLDDWLEEIDLKENNSAENCCIAAMLDPIGFQTDKKAGLLTKSFFSRFAETAGPGCRDRFIKNMQLFFKAVAHQVQLKMEGYIPDLESYIVHRRDNSCCFPCFQLIEYAGGFTLPDEVAEHPVIRSLEEATNDHITWYNDIFSFNVEQARNEPHNMVTVVMAGKGFTVQEAVDFVGGLCMACADRFENDLSLLPSWGPEVDRDVAKYVDGLKNWFAGSFHWSFSTERYFGKQAGEIKKHRRVELLPKKTN